MKSASRIFFESGRLHNRAIQAVALLGNCTLCPRSCGVNRLKQERGFCDTGSRAQIASYGAHFGEEQPLVGTHGSGTIFLASCSLRCCFCQNFDISQQADLSEEVEPAEMAGTMLELQRAGCHNINFVTPSHVVPQILEALLIAFEGGLDIPLVYNCSGYENVQTIKLLDGVIDIYMPDFKFWSPVSADKYADAPDYPEKARQSLKLMHRQVGDLTLDDRGLATRGLLVRHLLMPDGLAETEKILRFLSSEISPDTYTNIMDQYRPCGMSRSHAELTRPISPEEYRNAVICADKAGLTRLDERGYQTLLRRLGITSP